MAERILDRGMAAPPLFYQTEGAGPPLVLIHGVGADLGSWDAIAPRLAGIRRVLRPDLRGHGRSGRIAGPCALNDFVHDVLDMLNAEGERSADVAGFSLGGMIAQALALDHGARVERLALISAVAGRTDDERAKVQVRLTALQAGDIGSVADAARERWFSPAFLQAHPEVVAQRLDQLKRNDPESYKAAYTVFSTSDLGSRLHLIEHPTLIVTGEHDVGSNTRMAAFMHEQIAGSQLHILPGLRHSVLLEAPEAIAGLLERFLGHS